MIEVLVHTESKELAYMLAASMVAYLLIEI